MAKLNRADTGPLDRDAILEFIRRHPEKSDKRSIAREFGIKGGARVWLKTLMKQLERDGLIDAPKSKSRWQKQGLPAVLPLEVLPPDGDGDVICLPIERDFREAPPLIYLGAGSLETAPSAGDRVLAKIEPTSEGAFRALPFKALPRPRHDVVIGVVEEGNSLRPTDKRTKTDFILSAEDRIKLETGMLVRAEIIGTGRLDLPKARVIEVLGHQGDVGAISLISAAEHRLRLHFPEAAIDEAEAAQAVPETGRVDYRDVPLVTIDGADARDFDDAVWSEALPNGQGFRIMVAIADVAHYVRPGSALDQEAQLRGNSCYFPDRVLPMLPEALSNGWCSLVPHEDRGCLVADMTIDMRGKLTSKRFQRGIMRSAARLTYERVEDALSGQPDAEIEPLLDTSLRPLKAAYEVLAAAREERGALDLDVPERMIELSADKSCVVDIRPRDRLLSHKIIEELMILANVAAAQVLEAIEHSVMYRVHDHPDPVKLEHLANLLDGTPVNIQRGIRLTAGKLNGILKGVAGEDYAAMINQAVLRAQAQAVYAPRNIGHFGLGLESYAHFTSPIRRYADLTVHRALIHAFSLGQGGEALGASQAPIPLAEAISDCERKAAYAERSAKDRYLAAYHSDQIGQIFEGRISSVTKFGLFIELDRSGAHALAPMGLLPDDRYDFDAKSLTLEGRRWGRVFSVAQRVQLRLVEADGLTGSLVGEIVGEVEPSASSRLMSDSAPVNASNRRISKQKNRGKRGQKRKQP